MKVAGLILAGGQGRRMGDRDKGLLAYGTATFAEHLAGLMRSRLDTLAISANRHQSHYLPWADKVLSDGAFAGEGPLAGLLRGLVWATNQGAEQLLTVPCDTPALPPRYFDRALTESARHPDRVIVARVDGQIQPLHAVLPTRVATALLSWLEAGHRDVRGFLTGQDPVWLECDDLADGFLNVNAPADLRRLG